MKRIILIFFTCVIMRSLYSQEIRPGIYLTGTTIFDAKVYEEGFYRSETNSYKPELFTYAPIHFALSSKSKDIEISFDHYNFDIKELSKTRPSSGEEDEMVIVMKPRSFLDSIRVTDVDELFPTMTQAEAWKWGWERLRGRRIYIIDKNDMTADSIKLIQVRYRRSNEPISDVIIIPAK